MFTKQITFIFLISICIMVPDLHANEENKNKLVILLHGLARTDASFNKMEKSLQEEGYITCNVSYPSTQYPIEELVAKFVLPEIKRCLKGEHKTVNFVTHSMGGIVVRYLATQTIPFEIGRVVMLSPPNKGSEVVDTLGDLWLFRAINGPAGLQLSTRDDSLPNTLGKPDFELGIITGNKTINLILSTMIEGDNDGKVSVENAQLDGMKDFLVIEATHPFIMKNDKAIEQTKYFLENGAFQHEQ
jgi:triacylglycerol lipase